MEVSTGAADNRTIGSPPRSAAAVEIGQDGGMRRAALSTLMSVALLLPIGWPHHVVLGVSDPPGDAQRLAERAPVDARYQYLAGGVNTGHGWATWNPDGTFASMYVSESIAAHVIPVLTYYQLLQSQPAVGSDELQKDLSNLRDPATMRAYWTDYELLLRRVGDAAGDHLAIIHIEPDLWGYLEQAHAIALARSFAHTLIALRDRLAPHVLLAWHLSVWGTGEDPTYAKPSLAQTDQLAARSAAFYEALDARFDLVFNDVTDHDAGFYQHVEGNPNTWWGPADFRRLDVYLSGFTRRTRSPVVLWQLPLGDTLLNDTWGHYRDNRLQWWFDDPSGSHLRATRDAGVIGLLFGGGATGTTSDQTDGGFFYRLARRYEADPLALTPALLRPRVTLPRGPARAATAPGDRGRPRGSRATWRVLRPAVGRAADRPRAAAPAARRPVTLADARSPCARPSRSPRGAAGCSSGWRPSRRDPRPWAGGARPRFPRHAGAWPPRRDAGLRPGASAAPRARRRSAPSRRAGRTSG
ncbi:MAG: hypothetical protein ACLP50_28165 [Solirubrobacteraceae bacterium]